jgi:hypothetical protein
MVGNALRGAVFYPPGRSVCAPGHGWIVSIADDKENSPYVHL